MVTGSASFGPERDRRSVSSAAVHLRPASNVERSEPTPPGALRRCDRCNWIKKEFHLMSTLEDNAIDTAFPTTAVVPGLTKELESLHEEQHSKFQVWHERQALLRLTLTPVIGRLSETEVHLVLDAMSGHIWTREVAGGQVGPMVAAACAIDGIDAKHDVDAGRMKAELASWSRSQRTAFELWLCDLWRRSDEIEVWKQEVAWFVGVPSTGATVFSRDARA
jgi:hypothetical protein